MMHDYDCWGWGMGWGMWFIPLLIFFAIYYFIKNNSKNKKGQATETPLNILKKRYAKGEITKEQFEDMKKDLT